MSFTALKARPDAVEALSQGNNCDSNKVDVADHGLFSRIAFDLRDKGYSINPAALPMALAHDLWSHLQQMPSGQFEAAGIGRQQHYHQNGFVRSDDISWITNNTEIERRWQAWAGELQQYLNRQLLLGLFSVESHFAHYAPGSFYKCHVDAFKGETNRVLSMVVYLNPGWTETDGGELVLYVKEPEQNSIRVTPLIATVVVFLSEEFPHEVLPANRDRYSIAAWYRVNDYRPQQ